MFEKSYKMFVVSISVTRGLKYQGHQPYLWMYAIIRSLVNAYNSIRSTDYHILTFLLIAYSDILSNYHILTFLLIAYSDILSNYLILTFLVINIF